VPVALNGTPFQQKIWHLLTQIPYGTTISYLELAQRAGSARLTRAVGLANGANKLAIVIPCHRVVGSNGKLIGYAGGLWRKKWLLDFECRDAQPGLFEISEAFHFHERV
jgi:O-6-methylguanine DNA methyltransferase